MTTETPRAESSRIVFLFDVDNTLIDNDAVQNDLSNYLEKNFGRETQTRYWELYEELRLALGYADYLGALERYRLEQPHRPEVLHIANWLVDYPFASKLYPDSLAVVQEARRWGTPVILSDGDAVFQPRKVHRSGLGAAFEDHALIYVHKETELAYVESAYPADHYVLIDDKLRILAAVKRIWKDRVTTVFPKQGHYAREPGIAAITPQADVEIAAIGDLLKDGMFETLAKRAKRATEASR